MDVQIFGQAMHYENMPIRRGGSNEYPQSMFEQK